MSVISGLISRRVLPVCGSLCFFCPAMRARSRQPVKRYKKLISDIFPKNQVSDLQAQFHFSYYGRQQLVVFAIYLLIKTLKEACGACLNGSIHGFWDNI